jgi:hypothetical protein
LLNADTIATLEKTDDVTDRDPKRSCADNYPALTAVRSWNVLTLILIQLMNVDGGMSTMLLSMVLIKQ